MATISKFSPQIFEMYFSPLHYSERYSRFDFLKENVSRTYLVVDTSGNVACEHVH